MERLVKVAAALVELREGRGKFLYLKWTAGNCWALPTAVIGQDEELTAAIVRVASLAGSQNPVLTITREPLLAKSLCGTDTHTYAAWITYSKDGSMGRFFPLNDLPAMSRHTSEVIFALVDLLPELPNSPSPSSPPKKVKNGHLKVRSPSRPPPKRTRKEDKASKARPEPAPPEDKNKKARHEISEKDRDPYAHTLGWRSRHGNSPFRAFEFQATCFRRPLSCL